MTNLLPGHVTLEAMQILDYTIGDHGERDGRAGGKRRTTTPFPSSSFRAAFRRE